MKVAEHEHQREMMPKDIEREFPTGPRKCGEILEKLEIIINEMMADAGPVPMVLGNVGTHDAKMTQSDSDTSNDMRHTKTCVRSLGKSTKPAREQARRDRTGRECGIVEREQMNGRVAQEMTEAKKEAIRAPRAANLIGTVTRTKEALETKAKAKARVKPDTATIAESKSISE